MMEKSKMLKKIILKSVYHFFKTNAQNDKFIYKCKDFIIENNKFIFKSLILEVIPTKKALKVIKLL